MTRRLGLVGAGRIGGPVLAAWQAGGLPGWDVVGVLVRDVRTRTGPYTVDLDDFLARKPDLVVEVAGPPALAAVGERCLAVADVWTVSPVALADAAVAARLEHAARASGHRLRVLPGAFAALDGVASTTAAGKATLRLRIDLMPGPAPAEVRFRGTVREAARRYPNAVNVAVAAALAGPGLDATTVEVRHPGPVPRHTLALQAESAAGGLQAQVQPDLSQGVHPVACSVLAALRREAQPVWVG